MPTVNNTVQKPKHISSLSHSVAGEMCLPFWFVCSAALTNFDTKKTESLFSSKIVTQKTPTTTHLRLKLTGSQKMRNVNFISQLVSMSKNVKNVF